jgi:hypothetical protein
MWCLVTGRRWSRASIFFLIDQDVLFHTHIYKEQGSRELVARGSGIPGTTFSSRSHLGGYDSTLNSFTTLA